MHTPLGDQPDLRNQPCYEAHGDPLVEITQCALRSQPRLKITTLLFFAKQPLKLLNSPSSPCLGNLLCLYWFFVNPTPHPP